MKGNAITRIVLYSILLLVLIGILLAGLGIGLFVRGLEYIPWPSFDGISGGTVSDSGSVDADLIREIEVNWVGGSIIIEPGDTDTITFSETSHGSGSRQMVWKQSGGKLRIQFSNQRWSFDVRADYSKDLVITVPRDWAGEQLNINCVSADATVRGIQFSSVDFETVSGDLRYTGVCAKLDCESVSGNCIAVLTAAPREVSLDSVSGNLDITLPDGTGYSATIDSLSGRLSSDFLSAYGDHTYGDGRCRIDADTLSGDVVIRKG